MKGIGTDTAGYRPDALFLLVTPICGNKAYCTKFVSKISFAAEIR